ncbi:5-(carboxyamino)imidazole ribonucleotide synthase [Natronobacterium gregoryi]|uniref:N5-carboxyaminoimidazole ribonucleotide synthase n=2 Tax=Natronobacterium gregoryi TaxID=44930 RepID=L0AFB3_NATGS|nr:5-(carboxyamino)imidazole ribonucleotide synthase [Natronobacterium gregoryi]AFZ72109.1 phosphoribosylaminoimidazole carboxylase, PurK protein [Natronobacterium gregoryi SP2]ELY62860.1 phosphoribosylaminoimidazole carboxylase, ATPase subunit [Natronobacterium gregoryi SP2]PLK20083.1 5-(carboxyamino)imidazole ribonucleotide synthase [Natronobacterium gregoryi SP2]SFJ58372.1 5-(carboxyamino)imidazole ribonucleotide synthase [Natronobacterium gregoryi]
MTTLRTPGPTVGVVGGGQLGRMLAEAAAPLGVEVVVLDPTPDCPAALVARDQIVADFDDEAGIRELAARADVLTFEIELADQDVLERVSEDSGTPVHPDPATLETIHDKLVQKRELEAAGVPVPPFREVEGADDVRAAIDDYGAPVMLKARTGGYDGRGNVPVESKGEAEAALESVAGPAMVESFVEFEREVSVIAVEGEGEIATFPIGENVHVDEILRETIVPARSSDAVEERAREVAADVLEVMAGRGVYGIELFETSAGEILLNEIAPRPHNSGHWTIEGARSSQFEQHVRAVLGWPLAATDLRSPTVMTNLLGDVDDEREAELGDLDRILETRGGNLHWYGKRQARPLRKMGHVTVTGDIDADVEDLLETARDLEDAVTFRS